MFYIRWTKGDRLDEKEEEKPKDKKHRDSKDEDRSRKRHGREEPSTESTKALADRFETRGELRVVEE